MNERIADIMSEAFKLCKKYEDEGETGLVKTTEAFRVFAELIIRECSDLFEIEWGEEKLTGNDVGYVLKEHFGVEE